MRKKSVNLHVLQGTYREDRHGNVRLPVRIPQCPAGMTPAARKHWRRLVKILDRAGIISEVDGLSLRLLAESYDTYLTANEKLAAHGLIAKTTNGTVIQSPFLSIRNRAWEQFVKLGGSFGLNPAARNGMNLDSRSRGLGAHDSAKAARFFGLSSGKPQ
jgi:P27 family predicted phage terminase small subunit